MSIRTSFLIFISFLAFRSLFSQTAATDDQTAQIHHLLSGLHEEGLFNGTVLVGQNGRIVYRGAFGYADAKTQRKLEIETPFYLASVSKQLTTMSIMILEEAGKLSFDDRLSDYFPKFPAYARDVTIRQMMQHTSGIANHYALGLYRPGLTNRDVLHALINQSAPDFAPGSRYSYSNGAYVLLALIVEKVTGKSYGEYAAEAIFNPLEMTNTWVVEGPSDMKDERAIGHTPFGSPDDYCIFTTGAGGIYSTVVDMHKWDQALYTEKLVKQKTHEKAFSPAVLNDGSTTNYGFGWSLDAEETGRLRVSHSGSLNGFRTRLARDLDNKSIIVLLTNHTNLLTAEITKAIDDILIGEAARAPTVEDQYGHYVRYPEVLTQVLYAVISGDAGVKRDWPLFKFLFHPEARLIPSRKGEDGTSQIRFMSPQDYINSSGSWLEENGFHEREIHRKVERFGHMMHIMSTYESFRSMDDEVPFARGINSIQLHFDGTRWWIVNIFWDAESEDSPIPLEYLSESSK